MKQHILLVEDDSGIRDLFSRALAEAGFQVKEARDGHEGIVALQAQEYDAILLDLSLPRIDGVSALDTFKIMRNGIRVPVIVMTALEDAAMEQRARESGAAAFLKKPVTPRHVIETLREELAKNAG